MTTTLAWPPPFPVRCPFPRPGTERPEPCRYYLRDDEPLCPFHGRVDLIGDEHLDDKQAEQNENDGWPCPPWSHGTPPPDVTGIVTSRCQRQHHCVRAGSIYARESKGTKHGH
jgi:hypothetical protein